jgi:hypothetical protein
MAGDRSDLGLGTLHLREPRDRRTAQIVKRDIDDAGYLTRLAPGRPETVRGPRLAFAIGEDDRAALRHHVEHGLERSADRDQNALLGLALPQADVPAVIGRPRQARASPELLVQRRASGCCFLNISTLFPLSNASVIQCATSA